MQSALGPLDRLPGLQVGQRWDTKLVSPLTGRIETVRAEVTFVGCAGPYNFEVGDLSRQLAKRSIVLMPSRLKSSACSGMTPTGTPERRYGPISRLSTLALA